MEEHKRREEDEKFKEKVVQIRRVTKVVKGGKKMGFRAAVVVGTGLGEVGFGVGKAAEVSAAIRKGAEAAKKYMIKVSLMGSTITHAIHGTEGASKVILRPAPKGTGVIAGGSVRTILELAGIGDIVAKSIGSSNPINISKATIKGLLGLKTVEAQEKIRGKKLNIDFIQKEGEQL